MAGVLFFNLWASAEWLTRDGVLAHVRPASHFVLFALGDDMRGKKISRHRKMTAIRYRNRGMTFSDISRKMGLGLSTVRAICSAEPKALTTQEKVTHLLVNQKKSIGETATECGIATETVIRHANNLTDAIFVVPQKIPVEQVGLYRQLAFRVEQAIVNANGKAKVGNVVSQIAQDHLNRGGTNDYRGRGYGTVGEREDLERRIREHLGPQYCDADEC